MSRDGFGIIFIVVLFLVFFGCSSLHFHSTSMLVLFWIDVVVLGFVLFFFRDPHRVPPADSKAIVSPADGRVIGIDEVVEPDYVKGKVTRISIFLSIFDVHINYVPYEGVVEYLRYHRGLFFRADKPEASEKNAHTMIGLHTQFGKMAFKQAAGMIARRIVCHLHEGDKVTTGQKFGMIKFGSRMEVFLPSCAQPLIKIGEKLCAGESIIAKIHEK